MTSPTPTYVWVATGPIYLGAGAASVRAYDYNNVVPDSVVTRYNLSTQGLVERVVAATPSRPLNGVRVVTQRVFDEMVADLRAEMATIVPGTPSAAPDASSSTKGLVRLTGALGGTSASPTALGLASSSELTKTVRDIVGGMLRSGTGTGVAYDATAGTVTITATGTGTPADTTAPAIGSLTAAASSGQVALTWAATDNVAVTRYVLARGATTVYDGPLTSFTDTGRTNGTLLTYTLTAYDAAGNTKTATITATPVAPADTTAPAIGSLSATAGDGQITLAWTATDNVAVTRYVLARGATTVYDGTASSYTDTGRTNGTALTYTLTAYDAAGNTKTATASATPVAAATVTILFSDPMPQADGAAPDSTKWGLGKNPTAGGGATIQGGAMRLATGTQGGYAGPDAVARRLLISPTLADFEITIPFRIVGEVFPSFWFRSSKNDEPASGTGYNLNLGVRELIYQNNYANTPIATPNNISFTQNVEYLMKVRVVGSSVKARIWAAADTEPTNWNYVDTDQATQKLTAGEMGVRVAGGGAAASQFFYIKGGIKVTTPSALVTAPAAQPGAAFISGLSVNGVDGLDKATVPTSSPFYTWRGGSKPIGAVSSWADNGVQTTRKVWALSVDGFGPFPGIFDIAIGGLYPGEGQTWAQAAAGAYDDMYSESLTTIASYRRGKGNAGTYIRPFHEFNGSWYPWALHNAEEIAYFKQVWKRIWDLKQSIFPEAKLHWSPNRETSGLSIKSTDAWPGDAYVDAVAPDIYFQWPGYTTQAAWDAHLSGTDGTGGPKGIEAWRQFALAHDKPLCLPEWGTNSEPGDPAGPYPPYVDQPIAMKSMLDYLEANQGTGPGQFIYANYFNAAAAGDVYSGKFGLNPYTESPNAAAAYRTWHSAR